MKVIVKFVLIIWSTCLPGTVPAGSIGFLELTLLMSLYDEFDDFEIFGTPA